MKINTTEMRNGEHDGKIVWITLYIRTDLEKGPQRCIRPTKCLIVPNEELPPSKRIYYSKSHFIKYNKNDSLTKTVISAVENINNEDDLYIYDNESECITKWNFLIDNYIEKYGEYKIEIQRGIEIEILKLQEEKYLI